MSLCFLRVAWPVVLYGNKHQSNNPAFSANYNGSLIFRICNRIFILWKFFYFSMKRLIYLVSSDLWRHSRDTVMKLKDRWKNNNDRFTAENTFRFTASRRLVGHRTDAVVSLTACGWWTLHPQIDTCIFFIVSSRPAAKHVADSRALVGVDTALPGSIEMKNDCITRRRFTPV